MLEAAVLAASNKDNPAAMSEAIAAVMGMSQGVSPAPKRPVSPSQLDPEAHVPVVNLEDGTRLHGAEAPLKKDLEEWLDAHPAYMVDKPALEEAYGAEDNAEKVG